MAASCEQKYCHICGGLLKLTYEHLPPKSAFNDQPVYMFGLQSWLARDEDAGMQGGTSRQRGAGANVLCSQCNNNTGSWYVPELSAWAYTGRQLLSQLPPGEEWDRDPEPKMARVLFKRVYPLRFLKQIVSMLLCVNSPEFGRLHQELVSFVRDREAIGLPERYAFYLVLFQGPMARWVGLASSMNVATGDIDYLTEIAHPPFAYVMRVDTLRDVLPCGKISSFATFRYDQMCDVELDMVVGYGHTPYPADYRSRAAIETDHATGATSVP